VLSNRWLIRIEIAALALVAVVVAWVFAAPATVPAWEAWVFEVVNGLPDGLIVLLWPPMQFGGLVVASLVAAVLFAFRFKHAAVAYAVAVGVGWAVALVVKGVVERGRPLAEGLDVVFRSESPTGFGFISGHATVAFAGATVLWAFFGPRWGSVAYAVAALTAVARMFVGAHLPLDVIGGAAAGTLVGSVAAYAEARIFRWRLDRSGPASVDSPEGASHIVSPD
jgi:undecaprenyl-diphosphatase